MSDRLYRLAPHLALLAVILILWETAVRTGLITSIMVPKPSAIGAAFVELYITQRTIWSHFFITLGEAVFGFLIGAAIAIALAVGSSLSEAFGRYVAPYAVVLNVTPGLALTPIIIAWFGYGMGSKIALAAVLCFFPIFVNTLTGLRQTTRTVRNCSGPWARRRGRCSCNCGCRGRFRSCSRGSRSGSRPPSSGQWWQSSRRRRPGWAC